PVDHKWSDNIAGSLNRTVRCAGAARCPDVILARAKNASVEGEHQMKTITTLGFALCIAMITAGTAGAQVKFGVGGPITGPSAATGAQMKNGVDQAAIDINAAGGILAQKDTRGYCDRRCGHH